VIDQPNAASVGIVRDGKILLSKRALAPYQHLWTYPGGRIEDGETTEQCAIREIAEEIGLTVRNLKPVMVQNLGRDESFKLAIFATTDFSGSIVASAEIADHKWVDPSALIALRTTTRLDEVIAKTFAVLSQS
jgi:mutator protein MutT